MDLSRIGQFFELLERELDGHPDLHADLMAVAQFEPQILLPWLSLLDMAEQKLGDLQSVAQWLSCPHLELNGAPPVYWVGRPEGTEMVRELLEKYPLPPWQQHGFSEHP